MRQTAIIGDVHGDAYRLQRALNVLAPAVQQLIFVGDYVDRGPNSKGVLDQLVAAKEQMGERLVLLRGNHDLELLQYLQGGDIAGFVGHGGLSTVKSYLKPPIPAEPLDHFLNTFPVEHRKILEAMTDFVERDGLLVSHCGYDPRNPFNRSISALVSGSFPDIFNSDAAGRPQETVVFGHYVQRSKLPHIDGGLVCVDTGCGTLKDGPLTAYILPDRTYQQF